MADNKYEVKIGVELDKGQLKTVEQSIDNLINKNKNREINIDVNYNIKGIEKLAEVGKKIQNLKEQASSNNAKVSIPIDTKEVKESIDKIYDSLKKLGNAFGKVDKNKGTKSLLTSVRDIGKALDSVTRQIGDLNKNLTSLATKDLSLNLDLGLGNVKKDSEQIMKELRFLEKEAREYENQIYKEIDMNYRKTGKFDRIKARNSVYDLANQVSPQSKNYLIGLDRKMADGADSSKLAAYKEYIRTIKELISLTNYPIAEKVESRLAESNGFIEMKNEANEAKQKIKELFGSGIDGDKLSAQLDSVVRDLEEIRNTLQSLTSGLSVDEITQSFKELSAVLGGLTSNFNTVKTTLNGGFSGAASSINQVEGELKDADIKFEATEDHIENLKRALKELDFNDASIKDVVGNIEEMGVKIKEITHKLDDDGSVQITVKGIDDLERAVTAIKSVRQTTDKDGNPKVTISGFTKVTERLDKEEVQQLKEQEVAYKRMLSLAKQMGSIDAKIATLDADKNKSEIKELVAQLNVLESEYIDLDNKFGKSLSADQLININREFDNTTDKLRIIKSRLDDAFEMDEAAKEAKEQEIAFNRLLSIVKQMDSLEVKIAGLDAGKNTGEINELISQLNRLETEFKELYATADKNMTFGQADALEKELTDTANKIQLTKAKLADARAEMARKIKIDIKTGDFENGIRKIETKFDGLSNKFPNVAAGIDEVRQALREMEAASKSDNTEELISAKQRYEVALEKVSNQLDENVRKQKELDAAQKQAAANAKLEDDKAIFQSKIDAWLTKNSAAVKKFGNRMLELKAQIQSCDRAELDHLIKEFKQIDKEAEAAGVKAKSLGDRLRTQFSKYSTYFSAASVFMYVEQGLRSMFEQVVAIDSAMTELKKVTDETNDTYNNFLTNAASKSQEIGTTISDYISSTADFSRLGYDFAESQTLSEVANMYKVVGDEIDDINTASQSVISTMKAFKVEASGSMSIVDKFNEVSNNFAISSGGIGEALTRSASSLAAANNSLDESIALITASNSVVQDPTVVGRLMPTLKMAISVKG